MSFNNFKLSNFQKYVRANTHIYEQKNLTLDLQRPLQKDSETVTAEHFKEKNHHVLTLTPCPHFYSAHMLAKGAEAVALARVEVEESRMKE